MRTARPAQTAYTPPAPTLGFDLLFVFIFLFVRAPIWFNFIFLPIQTKKGPGAYPSWERDWSTGSFCLVNRNYDSDHDDCENYFSFINHFCSVVVKWTSANSTFVIFIFCNMKVLIWFYHHIILCLSQLYLFYTDKMLYVGVNVSLSK